MIPEKLFTIIEDRKKKLPKDSYASALFKQGRDRIVQKIGEEAVEVIIAAKGKSKKRTIEEIADLWFHTLVLMSLLKIPPKEIWQELKRRNK